MVYISIPDTTDTDYWRLKSSENKTKVFVPINPALHRQLLTVARELRPKRPNQDLLKKRR